MIVFIKGAVRILDYFVDSMAAGIPNAIVLDFSKMDEYCNQVSQIYHHLSEDTIVVTFNNTGIETGRGGSSMAIWEEKNVRFYNIIVDHPLLYLKAFPYFFPNMHIVMVDRGHCEFMKKNMPWLENQISFLPHGGTDAGLYRNEQRDVDVLISCSMDRENDEYPAIACLKGREKEFYTYCREQYERNIYLQADEIVDRYCECHFVDCTNEDRLLMCFAAYSYVEGSFIHRQKMMLLDALAAGGLSVTVQGPLWEENIGLLPSNVQVCGSLTPGECVEKIGHAKVLVNIHPNFTKGAHDRVFNAMLNGTVCVTNKSRYLESRFLSGQDILYVDFDDLQHTVSEIKNILADDALRDEMRSNAYKKVQEDTWIERFFQLISQQNGE